MDEPRQLKQSDIVYIRKFILEKQNGVCAICGKVPKIPCLDHHHKKRVKGSGLIRGVLCNSCNVFIAKSENNASRYGITQEELPTILRAAADYLEKEQYPYIHPSEAPPRKKLKKSSFNQLIREMKKCDWSKKFPEYPKSGYLTKPLEKLFVKFNIEPTFYK